MDKLSIFNQKFKGEKLYPSLKTGWTIKVYQKIKEGDKSRVQAFEGIIIAKKHGNEAGGTITVRKVSGGFGIEKTFPIYLPTITKIDVVKKSDTRKSKLYYLREKTSKETRRKMRTQQENTQGNKEVASA